MDVRWVVIMGVLLPAAASAEPADFVFRHGFDGCHRSALSRADVRDLLVAELDAQTVCIPPQQFNAGVGTVTTCGELDCAGGVAGCPVTIRVGSVVDQFGALADYQLQGTLDPFTVPVSGFVSCDLTITDAVHDDAVELFTAGDHEGRFLTALAGVTVDVHSYTTSGCSTLSVLFPSIEAQAETAAADAIAPLAAEQLLGLSVCPLDE